jgi:hypothetical protein
MNHYAVSRACGFSFHGACPGEAWCDEEDCILRHACQCACHAPAIVQPEPTPPTPKPLEACLA